MDGHLNCFLAKKPMNTAAPYNPTDDPRMRGAAYQHIYYHSDPDFKFEHSQLPTYWASKEIAEIDAFESQIDKVYLAFKNPFTVSDPTTLDEINTIYEKLGYDGLTGEQEESFVAPFNPKQIIHATTGREMVDRDVEYDEMPAPAMAMEI